MNKEAAVLVTKKEIQVMKDTLLLFDKVKEVVTSFDGKVLNKRFTTALETAGLKGVHYTSQRFSPDIYDIFRQTPSDDRSIKYGEHWLYHDRERVYFCTNFKLLNNRIVATDIIQNMELRKQGLLETIWCYEDGILHIDEMVKEYTRIQEEKKAFEANYVYALRERLNLNV